MTRTKENEAVGAVDFDEPPQEASEGSWVLDILRRGPDGSVSDLHGDSVGAPGSRSDESPSSEKSTSNFTTTDDPVTR